MGQLTQTTAQVQEFLNNVAVNPMTSVGDLIVGGSNGNPLRLAKGTAGQVLSMNNSGTAIEWSTPGSGGSAPIMVELSVSGNIFEPPSGGSYPQYSSATFSFVDQTMSANTICTALTSGEDVVVTFAQNGTTFYMTPYAYGQGHGEITVEFSGVATGSYADCYRCMLSMSSSSGYESISFMYTPYTYHS